MQITTIGLDLAKHVFQVHGVDANEAVVEKRRLRRGQVSGYFAGEGVALLEIGVGMHPA